MKKIAIIGTGISGMSAGYYLKDEFDITFFDKNDYPGGHTNTLTIDEDGKEIYIDSAFMVMNKITYPNLVNLFNELEVVVKPTDMSFSVQHLPSELEYCGTGLSGLFAQRKNILNACHWKMLFQMDRFNKTALEILDNDEHDEFSVQDYVEKYNYSQDFVEKFLVPISSAVWSTPTEKMLKFPIKTLVQFFKNHGFLGLKGHYQWYTPAEGSQCYRDKILSFFKNKVFLNSEIKSIIRENAGAKIYFQDQTCQTFDKVILATHSDQALNLLGDSTDLEKELLSKFKYQPNKAKLHTDERIMPKEKEAWSAWNYRISKDGSASTVYWMNRLQGVSNKKNYFVSINDPDEVAPDKILWERTYYHPLFDVETQKYQNRLPELNENKQIYFCGAYFRYGFHEDGLMSGMDVAKKILNE